MSHQSLQAEPSQRTTQRSPDINIANVGVVTAVDDAGRIHFLAATQLGDGHGDTMVHFAPPNVSLSFLLRPIANGVVDAENRKAEREARRKERERKRLEEEMANDETGRDHMDRRGYAPQQQRQWQPPPDPETTGMRLAQCFLTQLFDGLILANTAPARHDRDKVSGYGMSPMLDAMLESNYLRDRPRTEWQRKNGQENNNNNNKQGPPRCANGEGHGMLYSGYTMELAVADSNGNILSSFLPMDSAEMATASLPYAYRVAEGGAASSIVVPGQVYRLTVHGLSPYVAVHALCSPIVCDGAALDERIKTSVFKNGERIAVAGCHLPSADKEWPTAWADVYGRLRAIRDIGWRPWQAVLNINSSHIPDHVWRSVYRCRLALHGARDSYGRKSCLEMVKSALVEQADEMQVDQEESGPKQLLMESADRFWKGPDGKVVLEEPAAGPKKEAAASSSSSSDISSLLHDALQFVPPLPWHRLFSICTQLVKSGAVDRTTAARSALEWVIRATSTFVACGGHPFCRTVRLDGIARPMQTSSSSRIDPRTHFTDEIFVAKQDLVDAGDTPSLNLQGAGDGRSVQQRMMRSTSTEASKFRQLCGLCNRAGRPSLMLHDCDDAIELANALFAGEHPLAYDATLSPIVSGKMIWDADEMALGMKDKNKTNEQTAKRVRMVVKGGNEDPQAPTASSKRPSKPTTAMDRMVQQWKQQKQAV